MVYPLGGCCSVSSAAGGHRFIVEYNSQIAAGRLFDGERHMWEEFVAHPPRLSVEPGARVKDESMNAVGLKFMKLAGDLSLTELIIPRPQWRLRRLSFKSIVEGIRERVALKCGEQESRPAGDHTSSPRLLGYP